MPNAYYNAPSNNIPLTTVRSANENADRAAVESAFDLVPALADLRRSLYGTDESSVATLYEVTVPYLAGAYTEGQEITFEATYTNTGAANISINGGAQVPLVNASGDALTAGIISAGQMVKVIYTGDSNFRLFNVVSVGSAAVDQTADYVWTGQHDFSGATVLGSTVDESADYDWTGQHTYTQIPTISGNPFFYQSNINQAVVGVTTQTGISYTADADDANTAILFNNAAAIAFTIPPESSVNYDLGTCISGFQYGAGAVTITPGSGVTISNPSGLVTDGQYAPFTVMKVASDVWIASGALTV